jgi:ABC-type taurine transport system substrate-binding protein
MNEPTNGLLPLIAALRRPDGVDPAVIESFGDDEEDAVKRAIRWAWDNRRVRGMTKTRAAELIGMKNSHLTNVLKGGKYLPAQRINVWEQVMGNTAVSQTLERFRAVRERAMVDELAQLFAQHVTGRAA